MSSVNTVLGPVSADALGRALTHEHVFCVNPTFGKDYSGLNRRAILRRAAALFNEVKAAGYSAVADATVFNIGFDPDLIRAAAEETGLHFIVCVGAYWFRDAELDALSAEAIARRWLNVIERGFPGTGIRPGFIKCASQNEITPYSRKIIRAAAIAHRESGLPVSTHSCHDTALEQQKLLLDEGVSPARLTVGHVGDYIDLPLQTELLKNGSFIGIDRSWNAAMRAELVAALCRLGYAAQLTLSHDRGAFMDFSDAAEPPEAVWAAQDDAHTPEGRRHFLWLDDEVLPRLREAGVSDADIALIQTDNPKRFFGGRGE